MDSKFIASSPSLLPKRQRCLKGKTSLSHQKNTWDCFKFRRSNCNFKYHACYSYNHHHQLKKNKKVLLSKASIDEKAESGVFPSREEPEKAEKKGTIAGAVALIIGTSIGIGILALPRKASPAGVLPSSISILVCWAFLLVEALLLVEINVSLRKRRKKRKKETSELEIISIRTMAQETLGDWGGTFATVTYVFLGYTSVVAHASKSGEILFHFLNLPAPLSGFVFISLFTMLIYLGGTRATDRVNQFLTVSMIGLLLVIEVLAGWFGGWSGLGGNGDWGKVPATLPLIIYSLVYHDLAPVLCAYLDSDLTRLRVSVFLGSIVPLIALLVWDAIAIGLSSHSDQLVDPVELLMSVKWSGVSYMVEAFSLLAVGTSLIGTLLGFSEFFKEQLANFSWNSSSRQTLQRMNKFFGVRNWWGTDKIRFTAMAMAVVPSLFVSTTVPDAFSAATDIAGGYCMTMLYGVLPPAMAWAMHSGEGEDSEENALSKARPVLLGVGLFACGIVVEQILQDILALHS
ncbi:hypothetical protein UlMin_025883 [Ulmus minor]